MLRNKVKQFRDLHGLSQQRLADAVGLSRATVFSIETDPEYIPSGETMLKLAKYFNCDLGVLFYIERETREKVAS